MPSLSEPELVDLEAPDAQPLLLGDALEGRIFERRLRPRQRPALTDQIGGEVLLVLPGPADRADAAVRERLDLAAGHEVAAGLEFQREGGAGAALGGRGDGPAGDARVGDVDAEEP